MICFSSVPCFATSTSLLKLLIPFDALHPIFTGHNQVLLFKAVSNAPFSKKPGKKSVLSSLVPPHLSPFSNEFGNVPPPGNHLFKILAYFSTELLMKSFFIPQSIHNISLFQIIVEVLTLFRQLY